MLTYWKINVPLITHKLPLSTSVFGFESLMIANYGMVEDTGMSRKSDGMMEDTGMSRKSAPF